jgi:large subunit ribosomal protein L17
MYKRVAIKKLGRKRSHRISLLQNQTRTLFNAGVLNTTTAKAKAVRSVAQALLSDMNEKDISLATRRKIKKVLGDKELVEKAIKYAQNEDDGVRIVKTGFRSGDNAQMSRVELIGYEGKRKRRAQPEKKTDDKQRKKSDRGRKVNKDIEERTIKKTASGKTTKAKRKASERVRTRSGL